MMKYPLNIMDITAKMTIIMIARVRSVSSFEALSSIRVNLRAGSFVDANSLITVRSVLTNSIATIERKIVILIQYSISRKVWMGLSLRLWTGENMYVSQLKKKLRKTSTIVITTV